MSRIMVNTSTLSHIYLYCPKLRKYDFHAKCKGSESRQVDIERAIGRKRDKIMGKLKHNYNTFKELQTKFFHKQMRH